MFTTFAEAVEAAQVRRGEIAKQRRDLAPVIVQHREAMEKIEEKDGELTNEESEAFGYAEDKYWEAQDKDASLHDEEWQLGVFIDKFTLQLGKCKTLQQVVCVVNDLHARGDLRYDD